MEHTKQQDWDPEGGTLKFLFLIEKTLLAFRHPRSSVSQASICYSMLRVYLVLCTWCQVRGSRYLVSFSVTTKHVDAWYQVRSARTPHSQSPHSVIAQYRHQQREAAFGRPSLWNPLWMMLLSYYAMSVLSY